MSSTPAPKFPEIEVQLSGEDGGAMAIIGRVSQAMRSAGVSREDRDLYLEDSMSGNYDHLLQVAIATVTVH